MEPTFVVPKVWRERIGAAIFAAAVALATGPLLEHQIALHLAAEGFLELLVIPFVGLSVYMLARLMTIAALCGMAVVCVLYVMFFWTPGRFDAECKPHHLTDQQCVAAWDMAMANHH